MIKCSRTIGKCLDEGSVEHGVTDKLGRSVGYRWSIYEVRYAELTEEPAGPFRSFYPRPDDQQMNVFQMWGSPTRSGKDYGPSFNYTEFNTLEEARQAAVKRVEAARKRDTKKFGKEVAA